MYQCVIPHYKRPKRTWWYVAIIALILIAVALVAYAKGIDKGTKLEQAALKRAIANHSTLELDGQKWVSVWHRVER